MLTNYSHGNLNIPNTAGKPTTIKCLVHETDKKMHVTM